MKRILFVLTLAAACISFSAETSAQDLITKKDGNEIKAKVLEIDDENVRYRLFDEPEGVIYTVRKNDILVIEYQNGRKEIFTARQGLANNILDRDQADNIVPGMKYKALRHIYSPSDYIPAPGYQPYSPGLSGVLSFLIPGLGQMICDEVGRGFAFLGGTYGLAIVAGIGMASYSEAGIIVALAASAGCLAVEITSIVDAVKVAKVKNMYSEDLRRKYSFDMNLYPSVQYIPAGTGLQPTAGFTLAMNF